MLNKTSDDVAQSVITAIRLLLCSAHLFMFVFCNIHICGITMHHWAFMNYVVCLVLCQICTLLLVLILKQNVHGYLIVNCTLKCD